MKNLTMPDWLAAKTPKRRYHRCWHCNHIFNEKDMVDAQGYAEFQYEDHKGEPYWVCDTCYEEGEYWDY